MNLVPQILNILESGKTRKVLLVPKSPILMKVGKYTSPAQPASVVSPQDVRDTLSGLATMGNYQILIGSSKAGDGTFTISTQDLGRIRVNFIIQRGTPVIFIERIPSVIPPLTETLHDETSIKAILELIKANTGLILFTGSDADSVAEVIYSILKHVNDHEKKVIYTVENPLRYLLNNNKSVVVQREVKVDVESTAQGILQSLLLETDLLYVDDIPDRDALENLIHVASRGTLCLVKYPSWTPLLAIKRILRLKVSDTLLPQLFNELILRVVHLKERGKIIILSSQKEKDALFYGN